MKKATNNIIAVMISAAVLGIAFSYGVTFWEHWRTIQNPTSSFSSSPNSTSPISDKNGGVEPSPLEAPSRLLFTVETAI
jgi:hypothetical protein